MTDPELPPLDDDVHALLRRAAGVEAAPADARARVRAHVEARVGLGGGGGGSGAAGTTDVSSAPPAAAAPVAPLARRLLPLAVSFVLGGGAGALLMARATRVPAPGPAPAVAPRLVYVDRPVPAAAAPAPEPPPAGAARRSPPAPARNPVEVERRLLDVARGALERGEPAAALAATSKHERAFPGGVLVQEREAMAIRALAMLGRRTEAQERAARFHARYPDSVLWPAIASAVGASDSR